MTKKYEKFEEWMVGKAVKDPNGDVGVVIEVFEYIDGAVWVDWVNFGENLWIDVEDLTFIEEAPTKEEDVSILWEEGQVVWDVRYTGAGEVCDVYESSLDVQYSFGVVGYSLDGKPLNSVNAERTIFFSEPTIIADTMPPKKPFVPKLKAGDKIVMTDRVADYITEVVNEDEYDLLYKTEDGVVAFVKKDSVKVFKLGEEIKWGN